MPCSRWHIARACAAAALLAGCAASAGVDAGEGDAAITAGSGGAGALPSRPGTGGLSVIGLSDAGPGPMDDAGTGDPEMARDLAELPYARGVVAFDPGPHAGYGQDGFPASVVGPPTGLGTGAGSLDVLSLGVGGEIVVHFGDLGIVDGPGPDFVVFENPFWPGGDAASVFAEPGEVAVSDDGEAWYVFDCDPAGIGEGRFPGCAGWGPTLDYDPLELRPIDPRQSGGDAFDLAELGVAHARYVRVRDLSERGEGTTAGFDLDAVGLVHHAPLE